MNNYHTSDTTVQGYSEKHAAQNVTKTKLHHKSFDNNFQKLHPTTNLENANALLIVVLMVVLCFQIQF